MTDLREGLEEFKDYMIVPASAWQLLRAWYGAEGSALLRYIYSDPFRDANKFFIDLYPGKRYCTTVRAETAIELAGRLRPDQTSNFEGQKDLKLTFNSPT